MDYYDRNPFDLIENDYSNALLTKRLEGINAGAATVLGCKKWYWPMGHRIEVRWSSRVGERREYGRHYESGAYRKISDISEETFAFLLDEGLLQSIGGCCYYVREDWPNLLAQYLVNYDADKTRQDAIIAALEASEASENETEEGQ